MISPPLKPEVILSLSFVDSLEILGKSVEFFENSAGWWLLDIDLVESLETRGEETPLQSAGVPGEEEGGEDSHQEDCGHS